MLGVGTTAVVSHAAGRKDHEQALLLFNQSQVMAIATGVLFLVTGLAGRWPYARPPARTPDSGAGRDQFAVVRPGDGAASS